MIDYGKLDENLLGNTEKEFYNLEDQYKIFMSLCETIEKEMSRIQNIQDKEKTQMLSLKFQSLFEVMENINSKSKYIQNYINADNMKTNFQEYLEKLKLISFSIASKYEELNGKFNSLVENAKRRIDNEITVNTKLYLEQNGKDACDVNANTRENVNVTINRYPITNGNYMNGFDTEKIITEKVKMEVDRLKEKIEDLEKIAKVTKQILELSRDMKTSVLKQSRSISKIEDNLIDAHLTVKESEEELKKKKDLTGRSSFFFWFCTLISLFIVLGVVYLYLKL